jgi:TfoX-like protein
MAYDEDLAARLRDRLTGEDGLTEKAMFGGLGFMLDGNLAVGVASTGEVMVRVGPEGADDALARPHVRPFEMRGRAMNGWVLVAPEGVASAEALDAWVARGTAVARSLPPKG